MHRFQSCCCIMLIALLCATWPAQAVDRPVRSHTIDNFLRVAQVIKGWDRQAPGDLFAQVKAVCPDADAIVTLRELNKAMDAGKIPADPEIGNRQRWAMRVIRQVVVTVRDATLTDFYADAGVSDLQKRAIYGYSDIGSWSTKPVADVNMDVDWTILGTEPDATALVRDRYNANLLRELVGDAPGMTLKDFDVIATAEGHEAAAGVFETEGGIRWAKSHMTQFTLIAPDGTSPRNPDGTRRAIVLGKGDPVREMAYAEMMARLRVALTQSGDYRLFFDARHALRRVDDAGMVVIDGRPVDASAAYARHRALFEQLGVDLYVSKAATAFGGCLDMAKHLQEEALNKGYQPDAKLKKILKYVTRANTIMRATPAMAQLAERDALLTRERDVLELARQVATASPDDVRRLVTTRFGDPPDAGLAELGQRARAVILRMSSLAFATEMTRITRQCATPAERATALDKLRRDAAIVEHEGGAFADIVAMVERHTTFVRECEARGVIDILRANAKPLEQIRAAGPSVAERARVYLSQTPAGTQLLAACQASLELATTPVEVVDGDGFLLATPAGLRDLAVVKALAAHAGTATAIGGHLQLAADILTCTRNAPTVTEWAIGMGKSIASTNGYAAIIITVVEGYQQDSLDALTVGKALMYALAPETALPEMIATLSQTAITAGAQLLFDQHLDAQYAASTFDGETVVNVGGTGMAGEDGALALIDRLLGAAPAPPAGAAARAVAYGAGWGVARTVLDGDPKIFTADGEVLQACAGVRRCVADARDVGRAWGCTLGADAVMHGPRDQSLERWQQRVLNGLLARRDRYRDTARRALARAVLRTFEERRRAEIALDNGRDAAMEALATMQARFERLGIAREGMASLDAEGAPFGKAWTSTPRERQILAMKTLQRFAAAYAQVEATRDAVEADARQALGATPLPVVPLTGYVPLTAKPELDLAIAQGCATEVADLLPHIRDTLARLKGAPCAGAYDQEMTARIYRLSFDRAHRRAILAGVAGARQCSWSFRFRTAVTLNRLQTEATDAANADAKAIFALQEAFRAHYQVNGATRARLDAPAQLASGTEAVLRVVVERQGTDGAWHAVADDIADALIYAWQSGTARLTRGHARELRCRLDTVGDHAFTVVVSQARQVNGRATEAALGTARGVVTVTPAALRLRIDGPLTAQSGDTLNLTVSTEDNAPLPADDRLRWSRDGVALGTGARCTVRLAEPGDYRFTCEARDGAQTLGVARFIVTVAHTAGAGVSARVAGTGTPVVEGGSLRVGATAFQRGAVAAVLADAAATPALTARWSAAWRSMHPDATVTPPRPAGWGVDRFTVTWKSSGGVAFTPPTTTNDALTTAQFTKDQTVTIWGVIQQTVNGVVTVVGETSRETVAVAPASFGIRLRAEKTTLRPGDMTKVTVTMSGGRAPYGIAWSGNHAGSGEQVLFTSRRSGANILSVQVTDALKRVSAASITLQINGAVATMTGLEAKTYFYGSRTTLRLTVAGADAPKPAPGDVNPTDCSCSGKADGRHMPFCPNARISNVKSVRTTADTGAPPVAVTPDAGTPKTGTPAGGSSAPRPASPYRFVFQSDPGLTFQPPTSTDGTTEVTFDRMGTIMIWAEIQARGPDGEWETVDEVEPVTVTVVAPRCAIAFTPEHARVGEDVLARIVATPAIPDHLLACRWDSPSPAEWASRALNDRVIAITPRAARAIPLRACAVSPYWGDIIAAPITATFTADEYPVVITVKGTGKPPVQVWREGVGLVSAEVGVYAVDEHVTLEAAVTNGPPADTLRWSWSVNDGSTFTGTGSGTEIAVSRAEVGDCIARVTVRNSDGAVLGTQSTTVAFSVSRGEVAEGARKGAALTIALQAGRATLDSGESARVSATVSGGLAPHVISWTGLAEATGATATFRAAAAGRHVVTAMVTDAAGKRASASVTFTVRAVPLSVVIDAAGAPVVYTPYALAAVARGGVPPYRYSWSAGVEGQGAKVRLVPEAATTTTVTLTVVDAAGNTGVATRALAVKACAPTLVSLPATAYYGSQTGIRVEYPVPPTDSPLRAKAQPTVRWHADPPVRFLSQGSPATAIIFDHLDVVTVKAEVLNRAGAVVGVTEPRAVTVSSPSATLACFPPGLTVNQAVTATISISPMPVSAVKLAVTWKGADAMTPVPGEPLRCQFTPRDTRPVALRAIVKNAATGDTICSDIRGEYVAAPLTIAAYLATSLPPAPRVARNGHVVELTGAFAVRQRLRLNVKIVRGLLDAANRFRWSLNDGSYFDGDRDGASVVVYRKTPGIGEATVTALSHDGKEIGSAMTRFSITVTQQQLDEAERLDRARATASAPSKPKPSLQTALKTIAKVIKATQPAAKPAPPAKPPAQPAAKPVPPAKPPAQPAAKPAPPAKPPAQPAAKPVPPAKPPAQPAAPPAKPAPKPTPPRPRPTRVVETITFEGGMGERWAPFGQVGGDFAKYGKFEGGQVVVDVPEGHWWGKTGIYSAKPFMTLDESMRATPVWITVEFDPARTTGVVVDLSERVLDGIYDQPNFWALWRQSTTGHALFHAWNPQSGETDEWKTPMSNTPPNSITVMIQVGRGEAELATGERVALDQRWLTVGRPLYLHIFSHPEKVKGPSAFAMKRIIVQR